MRTILFVCTANQFRSPIAAACFSKKLAGMEWARGWIVQSAGTWASSGKPALPVAMAAARKIGISLEGHEASLITPELISTQDLILVMETDQKEALQNEYSIFSKHIFLLSEVTENKIENVIDPVMNGDDSYIESATAIQKMVENGFYRICGKALKLRMYQPMLYKGTPHKFSETVIQKNSPL